MRNYHDSECGVWDLVVRLMLHMVISTVIHPCSAVGDMPYVLRCCHAECRLGKLDYDIKSMVNNPV